MSWESKKYSIFISKREVGEMYNQAPLKVSFLNKQAFKIFKHIYIIFKNIDLKVLFKDY